MVCALAYGSELNNEVFNGYRDINVVVKEKQKSRVDIYSEYSIAWDDKWGGVDEDDIPADQGKRSEKSFANRVLMLKAVTELKEADAKEDFMSRTVEDVAAMCEGMTIQQAYDAHIEKAHQS